MSLTPRVFDTAILHKTTSSRAVTPNNANSVNNNFKIDRDGQLVASPMYNFETCLVKISDDDGYTWRKRGEYYITPRTNTNAEGPNYEVFYDKETDFVAVVHVGYGYIQIARDRPGEEIDDTSPYAHSQLKYSSTYLDKPSGNFMVFDGNTKMVYGAYINTTTGRLIMAGYDTTSAIEHCLQDYNVYNIISPVLGNIAIKSYEDKVHTVAQSSSSIIYLPFTKKIGNGNGSFGTKVLITNGNNFRDIGIEISGSGTLCTIYSTDSGSTASGFYSISTDNGSTWTTIGLIPPSGYSSVYDIPTSKYSNRSSIIGGYEDTFLISNCYTNNITGNTDLFVKEISPTDGTISGIYYGYGTTPVSNIPWRKVNSANGNIIGSKFFKYTDETIPNFGDKSTIHMAYQMGNQNDAYGRDSVSSTVFQEKLSNTAYVTDFEGNAFTKNLFDYYASGYINDKTKLYMSDFDKIGTQVSISKYEPIEKSLIDGKGGFKSPTTWDIIALIDPGSSTAPTVARGNAEFEEYIGRDSRKIFFKADCFLDRRYIINNGGYKKKTIYTIRLEDKDYEVEQILPRFFNNCIMYWEANLFVVSPTNDPFKG